jgi:hypothetical protein
MQHCITSNGRTSAPSTRCARGTFRFAMNRSLTHRLYQDWRFTPHRKGRAMGFRWNKRLKIANGVRLNLSKSGLGTSLGPRGARMSFGRRGRRMTLSIPGTGLSYSKAIGGKARGARRGAAPVHPVLSFIIGLLAVAGIIHWLF